VSRLAIIEPMTLVGHELRQALADHLDLFSEVDLYTSDPDTIGTVTEAGGRAAMVQQLETDSLGAIDLAIFCNSRVDVAALESLPSTATRVLIDPEEPVYGAIAIVAGVNSAMAVGERLLVSPNPAVILIAHLLHPLLQLGVKEVVAHVLQPASDHGQRGLEELFEQTRAIVSMADERPDSVFGTQLAFNLVPWSRSTQQLNDQLAEVLDNSIPVQLLSTQAGVFHSVSAGLLVRFDEDPGLDGVTDRLRQSCRIEIAEEPDFLGPVTAAAAEKVLVGSVLPAARSSYWIWSAMDNLISGGASNALAMMSAHLQG